MRPIVPLKSWSDRTQDSIKAISMGSLVATAYDNKVDFFSSDFS